MKRTLILTTFLVSALCQAMAFHAPKNDTLSTQPVNAILPSNGLAAKSTSGSYNLRNITVPEDTYKRFVMDESGENICLFSKDPETKEKKHPKVLLSVKRISDDKLLYSKAYTDHGEIFLLTKTSIVEIGYTEVTITDLATGAELLNKSKVFYMGAINGCIILKSLTSLTGKQIAYSMTTGEEMWSKKLISDDGITYNLPIDSVSDYIVTGNLKRVNWQTGDIQELESKTSIANKKSILQQALVGVAGGIAGGLLTGYAPIILPNASTPTSVVTYDRSIFIFPSDDKIGGLTSNICQESGKNYYADRNSIRCFSNDMTDIWKTELPEKGTRSQVFLKGDTLCMINLALGIYGGGAKPRETPYIALFSATDGKQFAYQPIEAEKQNVLSSALYDGKVRMLFQDFEAVYDLAANKMDYVRHDTTLVGGYTRYVNEGEICARDNSGNFTEIKPTDYALPVFTTKGYVVDAISSSSRVMFDDGICGVVAHRNGNTYVICESPNNDTLELWCIKNGNKTLIANEIMDFEVGKNALILLLPNRKLQVLTY